MPRRGRPGCAPSRRHRQAAPALVLTCEHAGNRIPRAYAPLFAGAAALLASHRGFDPGALPLARHLAKRLQVALLHTEWSRLLVEANRSAHSAAIWSRYVKTLPAAERERILARYWRPHRRAVETAITEALRRHDRVVHVAVHSFTPVLDGEIRSADVALLYDPKRRPEAAFARQWHAALQTTLTALRVRRNYPYRGDSDGLTTALRKAHPARRYQGLELEVNQAILAGAGWRRVGDALAFTLREALRSHALSSHTAPPHTAPFHTARSKPPKRSKGLLRRTRGGE